VRCPNSLRKEAPVATPAYRCYTVIKREGKDDYWLNLGVCFAQEDGEGFNLLLQAMPLDGKIVLRRYRRTRKRRSLKAKATGSSAGSRAVSRSGGPSVSHRRLFLIVQIALHLLPYRGLRRPQRCKGQPDGLTSKTLASAAAAYEMVRSNYARSDRRTWDQTGNRRWQIDAWMGALSLETSKRLFALSTVAPHDDDREAIAKT
jgi:hypothetical protein